MKASDVFVKALEAEGVKYVFGIPGEENLDLLESLRNSNIQLVLTRHEQAAGFMAATFGRLTGEAGVCLSTLGPGATNFVTAAAYAQLGAMPMVMVTGQKPIKRSKQGNFQIVDIVDMMRPLTKFTRQVVSGDTVPARVREAFRRAEEERPGACHLEFPEDIALEDTQAPILHETRARRPVAEDKAIAKACEALKTAKRPLLMIGAAANRKLTSKMLRQFVDETQIPFFTTQMGKGVVDETHPLFLGNAALSDNDFIHRAIDHADLILNVGHDTVEKPPFFMRTGQRVVVHINFLSAEVDAVYFPQIEVVGDIANSIWRMKNEVPPQPHWDFSYFNRVREALNLHLGDGADDARFPLRPQRLVREIQNTVPHDSLLCLDNGMYKIWFARNFRARHPNSVLLDNALATMGAGLPSAIAAKLVYPKRKIIAICGDGGFMMNSQELETAVRLKLDLTVLILRDNGYGMIQWKQSAMQLPGFGLEFGNPDFVKYAEAYGAFGMRVEQTVDLAPMLAAALERPGVSVIDVPIDYAQNHHDLNIELPRLTQLLQVG
jgi:acetolactate synthase I/II/III large subunit